MRQVISQAQDITGLRQQQPADSPSTSAQVLIHMRGLSTHDVDEGCAAIPFLLRAQAKTGTALLDSWLDDRLPNDQVW